MKTFILVFLFTVLSFFLQPVARAHHEPLIITTGIGALSGSVIIAQEKGFFREHGVKTVTTSMKRGKVAFQTYEQGKSDVAVNNSLHIVRSDFDASRHVIIGTVAYSDNQTKLVARKSAGIATISDLKGKKIALPKAGFAHFFLEKFLLFNGLTLDDVEVVFAGKKDLPDAIGSNRADGVINHGMPIAKTKELLGDDHVTFQNPTIHRKTNQILVPRAWVDEHREQAKGLLRAIIKAENFIKTHTKESIEILAKAKNYNAREMARTVRHEMTYYLSLKQSIFTELEGMENWALDNGIVARKTPRNYFNLVDFSLLEEIDPARVSIIR